MHDVQNSDESVHLQKNQASASQGFGLQLAPPSQPLPSQDHALSSQSPSQTNIGLSSTHVTSEIGEKGHRWLASTSSVQGLPCETSQGEVRNNISGTSGQTGKNAQGKFSAALSPGFPYSRSHIHNPHMYDMAHVQRPLNLSMHILIEQAAKGDPCQQVSPDNDHAYKTMSVSEGKESVANPLTGTSLMNPASTQREIEAFGRSLRPNSILHQNYSLTRQVQGMKNEEVDPDNSSLKRFKVPDGAMDAQQIGPPGGQQFYGHNMVRDASTNCDSIPTRDSKMLSFPARLTDVPDTNMPSQGMLGLGHNDTQNFANCSAVPVRTEQSQISHQMAPSWFDQYGTFKNGQILPLQDAQKTVAMKTMELPFAVGRPSNSLHAYGPMKQENVIAADASQHGLLQKGSITSPLPQLMYPDTADVSLAAVRPKSVKVLHQNFSAEVDWACATNRLTEKVEDETEMVEDGPPGFRSKRRLIFTTQLMQLLFHPPLASVLSADAMSHYESVVPFLARSTLGDACSTLLCWKRYFCAFGNGNLLDKRASVLDLRVECQELEKFSVINRFAKFHGRGQADGAETSSSSDAPPKSCLQRYVTALPMPRNLPDRVQCFSL
ncbi:hypothetical protein GH714_020947 [Hevea brasiliensis]|uniref:Uncharacterized protein n=1 Tax=Hevea brasiliensis TaxID=3981 RepID=A0A6A6MD86_HEVBR|nr:hypothetical protein GH714_020947 [Hevea brasiliensis]